MRHCNRLNGDFSPFDLFGISKMEVYNLRKKDKLFSTVFLAPAFIIYTLIFAIALIVTGYYSLLDWNGMGAKTFVGLQNYLQITKDDIFWKVAGNTAKFVIMALIIQVVVGLLLAYAVSRVKYGYKFFRSVFFLPVVISSTATALMFTILYNETGPLNMILEWLHLEGWKHTWLSDPKVVLYCVILPEIWQYIGVYFIIQLTGIQSISEDVIESARIDGASNAKVLTKIIIPMMSDIIQVCVIFALSNAIKSFNYGWIMTFGGPNNASSYISTYIYKNVYYDYKYGYGSAVAMALFLFVLLCVIIFYAIAKKFREEY